MSDDCDTVTKKSVGGRFFGFSRGIGTDPENYGNVF